MDVDLVFDGDTEYSPEGLAEAIDDLSADGLYVEVEGRYVNEALLVDEIELEEDDLEFKADVESVTAAGARDGTITLTFGDATGTVEVRVSPDTMFLDDDSIDHYDIRELVGGEKLEIKARMADDGTIHATSLHREDGMGYEIEGPLGGIDDVSVTVLDVIFGTDPDTFFEDGIPVVGDYVEVEDEDGDGIAESVEIDD